MRPTLIRIALGSLLTLGLAAPVWSQATAAPKAKTTAPTPRKVAAKIDLNTATVEQLEGLPGIGPARAAAIVKARPFRSVNDLKAIRGITPAIFAELSPHVTVPAADVPKPAMPRAATTKADMPRDTAAPRAATSKTSTPKAAAVATARENDPEHQARKKAALPVGKLINLNTATADELEELPYIGPARSAAIIKARPFATTDDVKKVEGIKEGIFGHIKDHITVK